MNSTNKFIIPVMMLILIGAGALYFFGLNQENDNTGEVRQVSGNDLFGKLSQLPLSDYDGNPVTLAEYAGTPLIINSWAVWCPFCRNELPDFAKVQKEFGDKVTFIAIDRAEPVETVRRYTDELGITNDMVFLLDSDDSFYVGIGGFSMPETIFVDGDGVVKDHKRGPMNDEEIRRRIQQAFNL